MNNLNNEFITNLNIFNIKYYKSVLINIKNLLNRIINIQISYYFTIYTKLL